MDTVPDRKEDLPQEECMSSSLPRRTPGAMAALDITIGAPRLRKPKTNLVWKKMQNLPCRMLLPQVVVTETTVYVGGGLSKKGMLDVYAYNLKYDKWTTLPRNGVMLFGLCMFRGNLVMVGGGTSEGLSNKVHTFNKRTKRKKWEKRYPAMTTPRMALNVFSTEHIMIACGGAIWNVGRKNPNPTSVVEVYRFGAKQWERARDLPFPCASMSTTVMGSVCYMMGDINHGEKRNIICANLLTDIASSSAPVITAPTHPTPSHCSIASATALAINLSITATASEISLTPSPITLITPATDVNTSPFLSSTNNPTLTTSALTPILTDGGSDSDITPCPTRNTTSSVIPSPITSASATSPTHSLLGTATASALTHTYATSSSDSLSSSSSSSSSNPSPNYLLPPEKTLSPIEKLSITMSPFLSLLKASACSDWCMLPPPPTENAAIVAINDYLLALGGHIQGESKNMIYVYTKRSRCWFKLAGADLPVPVDSCGCEVLKTGELIIIGGEDEDGHNMNDVYIGYY